MRSTREMFVWRSEKLRLKREILFLKQSVGLLSLVHSSMRLLLCAPLLQIL